MTRVRLFVAAAGLVLAACASKKDTGAGRVIMLPKGKCPEEREKNQSDPKKHVHVWEEYSWHTAEDWSDGVPMTKIVTVYRCKDCGEIRDESQRRRK